MTQDHFRWHSVEELVALHTYEVPPTPPRGFEFLPGADLGATFIPMRRIVKPRKWWQFWR